MTPIKKSAELILMFYTTLPMLTSYKDIINESKKCALIVVDEIIKEYQSISDLESVLVVNQKTIFIIDKLNYWQEVKQEIENYENTSRKSRHKEK